MLQLFVFGKLVSFSSFVFVFCILHSCFVSFLLGVSHAFAQLSVLHKLDFYVHGSIKVFQCYIQSLFYIKLYVIFMLFISFMLLVFQFEHIVTNIRQNTSKSVTSNSLYTTKFPRKLEICLPICKIKFLRKLVTYLSCTLTY